MLTDPVFYLCAVPAVILVGLAKGGFTGLGALGMPLMALGIDPIAGAAIMLPILIVQDIVGVAAFRKSWSGTVLATMLPGALLGILLAFLFASAVPRTGVLAALGLIAILFGALRLWAERGGRLGAPSNAPTWVGCLFGALAGFTSQIAHAGGPPFQMWAMRRGLTRDDFVGTSAIFFAVVNWAKVPAFAALGEFTRANVLTAAALLPVAILSSLAGVWLVRRVPAERFYRIIYALMIVTGAKLLLDAAG